MSVKSYSIGGKKYEQAPLVFGQWRQLQEVLNGLRVSASMNPVALLSTLGDRVPLLLAVVLTPAGSSPKGKDLPALADELEFSITTDQLFEVLDDFFTCNPVASLREKLAGVIQSIRNKLPKLTQLTTSSVASPEETSHAEIKSSGDSLQEKQPLT